MTNPDFHGCFECGDITVLQQAVHDVSPYSAGMLARSFGCGMWHFDFPLDPVIAWRVVEVMALHTTGFAGMVGREVFCVRSGVLQRYGEYSHEG